MFCCSLKLGMRNWSNSCIFEDSDIRFGCIIKSLDIVERATSLRHYLHAQSEGLATEEPLLKAYSCLETALEGTPSDVGFLTLFGDVNKALFELFEEKDLSRSALFKERAETSYKQAAQLDDRNPRVLMRYGLFLYRVESNLAVAEDKLLAAAELFLSVGMELGQELVLALVGLLDKRKQAEQAARLREAFLPLQHALMREPSILPPEDAGAAATRESSSKLLQKMGGKVGKILRKTPLEAEAEEDRVLEGYLLKRKKGKEKLATKKRWVVLGRGGELRYYTDVKGRLLGTLQLQQSTVSLEDPVLAVELHSESGSSGETYYFTTDFEGPSIMRWHDAMRNASGRSPRFFPPPARSHKELADSSKESPRTRTSIFHKAK
jgi:tetratricopeptide (TPR) repeat protein